LRHHVRDTIRISLESNTIPLIELLKNDKLMEKIGEI
jgi:hypothetical protein